MAIKILTGNTVDSEVNAEDDRRIYAEIFGKNDVVLSQDEIFAHELITNNEIKILSGTGMMQGTAFTIPYGEFETLNLDTCAAGYKRIDLICAKYSKTQNVESVELVVLKGLETEGEAETPEYIKGNILKNETENYMPLKKITYDGTNIKSVQDVFSTTDSKILWSGAYYMTSTHNAVLKEKISEQQHGVCLVFSAYQNGEVRDYTFGTLLIPKELVAAVPGASCVCTITNGDFSIVGNKTVYAYDDRLTGNASNMATGTRSGITYHNEYFVLRMVIGV